MNPEDLKYSKTHEWIRVKDDSVTIGITQHAQEALGDITFIELPQTGQKISKRGECGVIESVKAASDIYSPLSGEIKAVNDALTTAPEAINNDPYGEGWLFELSNIDPEELKELMDKEQYDKFLETEQ
ncbi:glycine cleavage system protein GcvH [Cellulosispirillum alkaliphilum]|uniref:glycine cleavage system protein GcvH n=1 Tax=Cellulosispirillum alkaliphilum TaxID=3039283 RepID=UPI003D6FDCE4